METLCVLVQKVGRDSEAELMTVLEQCDLSPVWTHFGNQEVYLLFQTDDEATQALKKLHQKTVSGKHLEVILLPSQRVSAVEKIIQHEKEVAQEEDRLRQVMSLFEGLSPVQQQLLLQTFSQQRHPQLPSENQSAAATSMPLDTGSHLGATGGASNTTSPSSSATSMLPDTGSHLGATGGASSATSMAPNLSHLLGAAAAVNHSAAMTQGLHEANWSPKITSTFNGKADSPYEIWRQEVNSLMISGHFTDFQLMMAIRRSVQGLAAEVFMQLESPSPQQCLRKFDIIFGNVLPIESVLENFWSSRQQEGESISLWACRLERMVRSVRSRDRSIFPPGSNSMLKSKFWSGLRDDRIKSGLRHLMDANAEYDVILVTARQIEMEAMQKSRSHQAVEVESQYAKKLDQVLALLDKLNARLNEVEGKSNYKSQKSTFQKPSRKGKFEGSHSEGKKDKPRDEQRRRSFKGDCWKCGQPGHPKSRCPLNFNKPSD